MWAIIDELYPTTDTCNSSTVARLKINLTRNRLSITSDLLSRWLDQLKWVECTVRSSQSSGFDIPEIPSQALIFQPLTIGCCPASIVGGCWSLLRNQRDSQFATRFSPRGGSPLFRLYRCVPCQRVFFLAVLV